MDIRILWLNFGQVKVKTVRTCLSFYLCQYFGALKLDLINRWSFYKVQGNKYVVSSGCKFYKLF